MEDEEDSNSLSADEDFRYVLASCYLDDAINSRNVPFVPRKRETRLYILYKSRFAVGLVYLAYLVLVFLAAFESPSAVSASSSPPFWTTVLVELLCLTFFLIRLLHELQFSDRRTFWKDAKHVAMAVILASSFVDVAAATAVKEFSSVRYVRWSRPLRPFIIVASMEGRQLRQGFRNIRRTLPEILNVLLLFFFSISIFALMGFKLFGPGTAAKSDYFRSFPTSLWQLYVFVTSANSPDVIIPSYVSNRWSALFFVLFIVTNLYIFMSVFLAVIYNQFKSNLKNEVRDNKERRRRLLGRAFELLSESESEGGGRKRSIKRENFLTLIAETFSSSTSCRGPSQEKRDYFGVLWSILSTRQGTPAAAIINGGISEDAFVDILDLIKLPYKDIFKSDTVIFESWFPRLYSSAPSRHFVSMVRSRYFRYIFDVFILTNAFFIAFDFDGGEKYFLMVFLTEILCKMYAFGIRSFFSKLWNMFDFFLVGSALIVSFCQLTGLLQAASNEAIDVLMILRVIRIFKVFHAYPRFKSVLNTLATVLPSLATYGGILITIFYFFAIIGMELFGDKIKNIGTNEESYCGNFKLKDSEFYSHRYCSSNFNDLFSSYVTLFELLIVNQWHVITEGFVLVSSPWAKLYFISFHVVCVIVILNIFIAFVLEAFILEYGLLKSKGIKSPLLEKIQEMGLLLNNAKDKEHHQVGDADHEDLFGEQRDLFDLDIKGSDNQQPTVDVEQHHQQVEDPSSVIGRLGFPDHSNRTSIRFYIKRRQSRSVQDLLDRMFGADL